MSELTKQSNRARSRNTDFVVMCIIKFYSMLPATEPLSTFAPPRYLFLQPFLASRLFPRNRETRFIADNQERHNAEVQTNSQ